MVIHLHVPVLYINRTVIPWLLGWRSDFNLFLWPDSFGRLKDCWTTVFGASVLLVSSSTYSCAWFLSLSFFLSLLLWIVLTSSSVCIWLALDLATIVTEFCFVPSSALVRDSSLSVYCGVHWYCSRPLPFVCYCGGRVAYASGMCSFSEFESRVWILLFILAAPTSLCYLHWLLPIQSSQDALQDLAAQQISPCLLLNIKKSLINW